jgi:L-threonylcarbamoyladenylate synthase
MERWPANAAGIRQAADKLRSGAVISFPTDTLYAIAARAADRDAVARLYMAKRRPTTQPLIWLVADQSQIEGFAIVGADAARLIERHWPGPLTLVLPTTAKASTLAVRAPNHPVALQLLRELGEAVASSSANRAGEAPPLDADAVVAGFGDDLDLVLDGGPCQIGVASTILDLSGAEPRILREGVISAADLEMPSPSGEGRGGG